MSINANAHYGLIENLLIKYGTQHQNSKELTPKLKWMSLTSMNFNVRGLEA